MKRYTTKRWTVTEKDGKTPNLEALHRTIDSAHQEIQANALDHTRHRVRPVKITVEYLDE